MAGVVSRCESVARLCALAVATLGIAVLLGWALDIAALKSVLPGLTKMVPNTAFGFLLAGTSLAAAGRPQITSAWRTAHLFLAAIVALLGLLTLGEYLFAADFGIDQLLLVVPSEPGGGPHGGMAIMTAAGLALSGLALLLLDSRRGRVAAQIAALFGSLIGVMALLGYVYGVGALYDVGAYASMALHTAAGLVILNFGVLLVRPQHGLMAAVTSQTAGGFMARRLLPFAMIAPFLIGWLRVQGEREGMVSAEFGTAAVQLTYIVLFSALIWRTAEVLRCSDRHRLAAEQMLRQQQAQMTGIVDSAMDAVIMVDGTHRITLFNPAAVRIFGHQATDVFGAPLDVLLPERFRARHAEQIRAFASVASDSRHMGGCGLRANGEEFPIEASISPLDVNGERCYTVILRDVTDSQRMQQALKDSEQRYMTLSAGSFEGVVVSENGVLIDANAQFATMLGYEREALIGRQVAELMPPDVAEQVVNNIRTGIDACVEQEMLCRNGSRRLVETHGQSLVQADRTLRLTAFRDITECKIAQTHLEQALHQAETATRAKSEFLAHMSHEIRTPMNAIVGAARLIEYESLTPRQRSYTEIMRHSSQALLLLIDDILDLSKIEAGQIELSKNIFPLAPMLDKAVKSATVSAMGKNLEISLDLAPDMPPMLIGDQHRLEQVLNNLLSNAIKFTDQGEIALRVQRLSADAENTRLLFVVSDTGIGIAREQLNEIFHPFVQAENTTTRTRGGTGLGLSISRQLVELMGGAIEVESVPGKGSDFAFTAVFALPSAIEIDACLELSDDWRIHEDALPPVASPLAGRRVLMVEDNQFNRVVLEGMLQHLGIEVDAAVDGHDGIECFQIGSPYDAILMDLHLPGLDGFACTRAIRAQPAGRQLPIIALTANVLATTADECYAAGMNDHLLKPVEPETLRCALMHWILGDQSAVQANAASINNDLADRLPDALPGIDPDKASGWSNGSARALAKLLDRALAHSGDDPANLARHLAAGDLDAAAQITHDLMAVAATIGASALVSAARQLHQEIRSGSPDSTLAQEAINRIGAEFARLNASRKILRQGLDLEATTPGTAGTGGHPKPSPSPVFHRAALQSGRTIGLMNSIDIFPWNANFNTGVPKVDEQHQRLVELLNLLASHLAFQADIPRMNVIFDELADYAAYHFETEEAIWHEYLPDDPLEAKHLEVHDKFTATVLKLKSEESARPAAGIVADLLSFLARWLASHILETDLHMATVVLAMQSGMPLTQAKEHATRKLGGTTRVLIDIILATYGSLAANTLQLMKEIAERKHVEQQLHIAATVFESHDGMIVTDANNVILKVNRAFSTITGYTSEEAIGQHPSLLSSGRHDADFYTAMWETIHRTGSWDGEIWNRRKNGEVYPEHLTITAVKDVNGIVINRVATFNDITASKASADEIRNLAFYDPLTHLPNRRLLLDRLKQALASSARTARDGALLFIDLDNFKTLNDTLGHYTGDLLLQQVADRLTACVREDDTVARIGGDEFVVMLEDLSAQPLEAAAQTEAIANKIMLALNQPYQLGTYECHSSPSIGATIFCDHEQNQDELLKQADIAMYQAKKAGRNTLRFFDPQMQDTINTRATLEGELRKAIEKQQFQLYYQVQLDSSNQALGAEALIRWIHPERGLIPPAQFIPLSEETGLIVPIGQWVLETACAQLKTWQKNVPSRKLVLAVNVSAKQFCQPNFVAQVQASVQRYAINPELLKLELTESMLQVNIEETIAKMAALKAIGVQFSLDDFGTGFSSLQYIKRLPLTQLKIDQSFVNDLAFDLSDRAIVRTIVAMAKSLDLDVIAEGVETAEQQQMLAKKGCTHYQGYLFGRPVPIEQFDAALAA